MKRNINLFIEDIIENIKLIEDSTRNLSKLEFTSDRLIIDATIRRLEVIGEAVKNIPDFFRDKYKEIPWRKIAGLRDIIIHAYFNIDLDTTWDILKINLPDFKEKILKIKQDIRNEGRLK